MEATGTTPVVDSHAHFWRWPDGPAGEQARRDAAKAPAAYAHPPMTADELLAHLDDAGVDKLVQVQRTAMGFDNSYSLDGARQHADRIRVLVRVDPRGDDLPDRLGALLDDPMVVGARVHHFPPEDEWLTDGTYDAFWALLEERGHVASVYAPRRPDLLATVAARHPDLRLVVDHAGTDVMPDTPSSERLDGWADILALADHPSITMKVSGLPEATEEPFPFTRAQECLAQMVEAFGADRLMWGSNFPPTERVCSYPQSLDWIRSSCSFLQPEQRTAILGGTASRVLRLPW